MGSYTQKMVTQLTVLNDERVTKLELLGKKTQAK